MILENNQNQTEKYVTESKFEAVISDLKQSILDGFDKIFYVMDDNNKQLRAEITAMLKSEISDLRQEMNQRFLVVDNRLLKIERNMVYKHEFDTLAAKVEGVV